MTNNNTQTEAAFLAEISHPRHKELAEMILNGDSVESMKEAGYGRITILEMASKISRAVEGREDFSIEVPATDEEIAQGAAPTPVDESEKKTEQELAQSGVQTVTQNSIGQAPTEVSDGAHETTTAGGNPQTSTTGEEDEETLKRREEEAAAASGANADTTNNVA